MNKEKYYTVRDVAEWDTKKEALDHIRNLVSNDEWCLDNGDDLLIVGKTISLAIQLVEVK